MGFTGFELGFS